MLSYLVIKIKFSFSEKVYYLHYLTVKNSNAKFTLNKLPLISTFISFHNMFFLSFLAVWRNFSFSCLIASSFREDSFFVFCFRHRNFLFFRHAKVLLFSSLFTLGTVAFFHHANALHTDKFYDPNSLL